MTFSKSKPLALVISILAAGPLLAGMGTVASIPAFAEVTISTSGDSASGDVWDAVTEDGTEVSSATDTEGGAVDTASGDTCEDVSDHTLRVSRC